MMSLKDEFESHVVDWQSKLQREEWYFTTLRKELTDGLEPHEAFSVIPEAVDLTLEQSDRFLCLECFELLLALARVSDTTEVHPVLNDKWEQLCSHVSQFGRYSRQRVAELGRWYRRST